MRRLFLNVPWFISAPTLVAIAAVLAFGVNYLFASYFERTFLNEADPITAEAASAGAAVIASGNLRSGDPGHHGSGSAKLIRMADGKLVLRFEKFSVTNGPDLFVILSTDPGGSRSSAADGLNLGENRATDGNVNYEIAAGTDVSKYKSAIIYCRQFRVVFAFATLEPAS